jgi:hypothetical protein
LLDRRAWRKRPAGSPMRVREAPLPPMTRAPVAISGMLAHL